MLMIMYISSVSDILGLEMLALAAEKWTLQDEKRTFQDELKSVKASLERQVCQQVLDSESLRKIKHRNEGTTESYKK